MIIFPVVSVHSASNCLSLQIGDVNPCCRSPACLLPRASLAVSHTVLQMSLTSNLFEGVLDSDWSCPFRLYCSYILEDMWFLSIPMKTHAPVMLGIFLPVPSVRLIVLSVKLRALKNQMRSNDFHAEILRLFEYQQQFRLTSCPFISIRKHSFLNSHRISRWCLLQSNELLNRLIILCSRKDNIQSITFSTDDEMKSAHNVLEINLGKGCYVARGGGGQYEFTWDDIKSCAIGEILPIEDNRVFHFEGHTNDGAHFIQAICEEKWICHIPLPFLIDKLPIATLRQIASQHEIQISKRVTKADIYSAFTTHDCTDKFCRVYKTIFKPVTSRIALRAERSRQRAKKHYEKKINTKIQENDVSTNPEYYVEPCKSIAPLSEETPTMFGLMQDPHISKQQKYYRKYHDICSARKKAAYYHKLINSNTNSATMVKKYKEEYDMQKAIVVKLLKLQSTYGSYSVTGGRSARKVQPDLRKFRNRKQVNSKSQHEKNMTEAISLKKKQYYLDNKEVLIQNAEYLYYSNKGSRSDDNHLTEIEKNTTRNYISASTAGSSISHNVPFPPEPPSDNLKERIIRDFCTTVSPENLEESGCAVCGKLTKNIHLSPLESVRSKLDLLYSANTMVARRERKSDADKILPLSGPVLADDCDSVCMNCRQYMKEDKIPPKALVNYGWKGKVPPELQGLTYAERLMVSIVRHNRHIVKVVKSGLVRSKLAANVICFKHPIEKVYKVLPPSKEDLQDILSFLFLGPTEPTPYELKRVPLLVRHKKVMDALTWLKLNHRMYHELNLEESREILNRDYMPENQDNKNIDEENRAVIPFKILYRPQDGTNKIAEATAVNDYNNEDGADEGECPFKINTLAGDRYVNATTDEMTLAAMEHLKNGGKVLGFGHAENPESLFNNKDLYTQMFPWLYPYGLGVKEPQQELMYHDKRFQYDAEYTIVHFNHQQIRDCSRGGYLIAQKKKFAEISKRLHNINKKVIGEIAARMDRKEYVKPKTQDEKDCFQLLRDLDHVAGSVKGSVTQKKYMRTQLWSLINYRGSPSWFITLSPDDTKHPICIYYADKNQKFTPDFSRLKESDRIRLITSNPVACARFFHTIIEAFVKNVLKVGSNERGIFGDVSSYYGVVEQQGRLTLHIHMLLWIRNSLSSQKIREGIMDENGSFQKKIIEYIENTHQGGFINATKDEVKEMQAVSKLDDTYIPPTLTLPIPPPINAHNDIHTDSECEQCKEHRSWKRQFNNVVNDLLLRCNIHVCRGGKDQAELKAQGIEVQVTVGCRNNKYGTCKARFPRKVVSVTSYDPDSGYLELKHAEPDINTINDVVTYVTRSNSDVTSVLSGTAMKAVIGYCTSYISKCSLKMHTMFNVIDATFDRYVKLMNSDDLSELDRSKKMITKMVNALTAKLEIGSPMAAMYVLGNPDHYTNEKFKSFYWHSFVGEVRRKFNETETENPDDNEECEEEKVMLTTSGKHIVALSPVQDYTKRPREYEDICLFDWMRLSNKEIIRNRKKGEAVLDGNVDNLDEDGDIICAADGNEDHVVIDEDISGPNRLNQNPDQMDIDEEDHQDDQMNIDRNDDHENQMDIDAEDLPVAPLRRSNRQTRPSEKQREMNETLADMEAARVQNLAWAERDTGETNDIMDQTNMDTSDSQWSESEIEETNCKRSSKIKNSLKLRPGYRRFLSSHSQYKTHSVTLLEEKDGFIPNFIGGKFPRRDADDQRDYYCCTMLTFFKPWRECTDLKDHSEQWEKVFDNHTFTDRQKELMDNFHIRYECLDSRDDFTAQLRQNGSYGRLPKGISHDDLLKMDEELRYGDSYPDILDHDIVNDFVDNQKPHQDKIDEMLHDSGWKPTAIEPTEKAFNPDDIVDGDLKRISEWAELLRIQNDEETRRRLIEVTDNKEKNEQHQNTHPNQVQLIDNSYLKYNFTPSEEDLKIMQETITEFSLNEEQERAFRIVANHATTVRTLTSPRLNMYLGGMGGTGKSQVIRSLKQFFNKRGEPHRMIVLAPTGTAAVLVGGFTYHSILCIYEFTNSDRMSQDIANKINQNLKGVEYVFLDEVSMVSCHNLYKISAQLQMAKQNLTIKGDTQTINNEEIPFGGLNMIFAGDFAQLPPVNASSLYSGTAGIKPNSLQGQQSAVGRGLWQQITTVVILRKNMRQNLQGSNDAKLRTALENMRYKSCTPEDVVFLRSRVAGEPNVPDISEEPYRNSSVIVSTHRTKDRINLKNAERFAKDHKQPLYLFYSIDNWADSDERKRSRARNRPIKSRMSTSDQESIWKMPMKGSDDKVPPILPLCKGLPVLIRYNDATVLGVTRGQEGHVVGWTSRAGSCGNEALDVVFVKLHNPVKNIHVSEELGENIVPIVASESRIEYKIDGEKRVIRRRQVNIHPNFAMTEFSAQGKSRDVNIVYLQESRCFHAIYTALSRGTSADKTVILGHFSPSKITGKCSGPLRAEYRELELLDEITKFRYLDQLPSTVDGHNRVFLLKSFWQWKNEMYIPSNTHPAIRWKEGDRDRPDKVLPETVEKWRMITKESYEKEQKKYKPANGSVPINVQVENDTTNNPLGINWDSANHSCGYDTIMVILYDLWRFKTANWTKTFRDRQNNRLDDICNSFSKVRRSLITLEQARDSVRKIMFEAAPEHFEYGPVKASIIRIAENMLLPGPQFYIHNNCALHCPQCNTTTYRTTDKFHNIMHHISNTDKNPQEILNTGISYIADDEHCTNCHRSFKPADIKVVESPNLIMIHVAKNNIKKVNKTVSLPKLHGPGEKLMFRLSGIVYHEGEHFTARICNTSGIWYHCGIDTGTTTIHEGKLSDTALTNHTHRGNLENPPGAVLTIYTRAN